MKYPIIYGGNDKIKISGPITMSLIVMKHNGNDIIIELYGDRHESIQGLCEFNSINFNQLKGLYPIKQVENIYLENYLSKIKKIKDVNFIYDYLNNKRRYFYYD